MKEKLLNRVSQRNFSNKLIEDNIMQDIKDVINSSATSINGHGFSAIIVTDEEVKKNMAKLNYNQQHVIDAPAVIVFVGDLSRTKSTMRDYELAEEFLKDELFTVSIVDATIASTAVATYALSIGIDHCYLGGVRSYSNELKDWLNLNDSQFPVLALALGYPEDSSKNEVRRKLNKTFDNKYDQKLADELLEDYNNKSVEDFKNRATNSKDTDWKTNNSKTYNSFNKREGYKEFFENKKGWMK